MKKIVRLTESDLARIVRRVMNEGMEEEDPLEGHISVYNEYKDGKISKDLFYRFIGVLDRRDKERLLDYIRSEKEENESLNEGMQPYDSQKIGNELRRMGHQEGRWKKIKTDGTLNLYYIDKKTNKPVFHKSIDTGWGDEINTYIPKINQVGTWALDGTGDIIINY